MLDTHARKFVSPIIKAVANMFLKAGFKPNHVTILGFAVGILPVVCLFIGAPVLGVILLWLSGLLDAVDGAMARISGLTSEWGAFMDICFDRIVEAGILLALGFIYPESRFALMVLLVCILLSMTVFLTVGALEKQKKEKAFYYQAGLAERTEGFLFLTAMILFQPHIIKISYLFACVIVITIAQRACEAYHILNNK